LKPQPAFPMNPDDSIPSQESNPNPTIRRAEEAWETAKNKAEEGYAAGERYVRDHPGSSALTIFGMGFVVGVLIGWSVARQEEESYFDRWSRTAKDRARGFHLW